MAVIVVMRLLAPIFLVKFATAIEFFFAIEHCIYSLLWKFFLVDSAIVLDVCGFFLFHSVRINYIASLFIDICVCQLRSVVSLNQCLHWFNFTNPAFQSFFNVHYIGWARTASSRDKFTLDLFVGIMLIRFCFANVSSDMLVNRSMVIWPWFQGSTQ